MRGSHCRPGTGTERDVQAEHDEIVRAALAHDANAASAALCNHIERSTTALLRHAGE
jgi:DNA-binding GntR family transcriptional regulator